MAMIQWLVTWNLHFYRGGMQQERSDPNEDDHRVNLWAWDEGCAFGSMGSKLTRSEVVKHGICVNTLPRVMTFHLE